MGCIHISSGKIVFIITVVGFWWRKTDNIGKYINWSLYCCNISALDIWKLNINCNLNNQISQCYYFTGNVSTKTFHSQHIESYSVYIYIWYNYFCPYTVCVICQRALSKNSHGLADDGTWHTVKRAVVAISPSFPGLQEIDFSHTTLLHITI